MHVNAHIFSKVKQCLCPHDGIEVTTFYSGNTIAWEIAGQKLMGTIITDWMNSIPEVETERM